jgi:type VI secretion system protein ImpA
MSAMDIQSLLQPLPGSSPCGADLEYDPEFLELDRLIQGKPEQQMGGVVVPAQEPDWALVGKCALALFAKTKDLRVGLTLARAALYTDGLAGLRDGLAVLRGLVEQYWEGVYPRLDPSDGDSTFRINILTGLCDGAAFIDRIRGLPLVLSRNFGGFSLRDLALASGELQPVRGTDPPAASAIEGAFSECPVAELQSSAAIANACLDHLAAIEAAATAHVGVDGAPSFAKLSGLLEQASKVLTGYLGKRSPIPAMCADGSPALATAASPTLLSARPGTVGTREDVVRLLDQICDYYERAEPSSPLPLLLGRCKRLVSANFMDIIRDLAPGGVPQVETLRGKDS